LRARLRILGVAGWTALWFLLWGSVTLLTLPFATTRLRWRHFSVRHWSRGLCRILGMHCRVVGTVPRAPFLLVTNHLSYLDILLLFTCADGVFIAKRDMRSWPLLGALAQLTGTIWVKREVRRDAIRVLDDIDSAIARGDGVVLFPEATTSSGTELLPFRPALLEWAARRRYPVHYATIGYRTTPGDPPAQAVLCWWGGTAFATHARGVLRLKRFEAIVNFAAEPVIASSRKELAVRLREAIGQLHY